MLRKIRVITAILFFTLITFLFLDFTGTLHKWLDWIAKVQLVPAILAVNLAVLALLFVLTLLFGRIYCSVICPLGVFQDGVSHVSAWRKGKKNRFNYSKPVSWLRYSMLLLFIIGLIAVSQIVSLLDPYATYGRMVSGLLSPLYIAANNLLAWVSERMGSYAFYEVEVWIKSGITLAVSIITLLIVSILAWKNGRTYCNTLCPVGTILGLISRFSIFRISFDKEKCKTCGLCERSCKAACIDSKTRSVDHSRCVTCFNCIDKCRAGAVKYTPVKAWNRKKQTTMVREENAQGVSRRDMLSVCAAFAVAGTVKAQEIKVDGGLAAIEDKKIPDRKTPIVPPGAWSLRNMKKTVRLASFVFRLVLIRCFVRLPPGTLSCSLKCLTKGATVVRSV